jgi:hypothetical protein
MSSFQSAISASSADMSRMVHGRGAIMPSAQRNPSFMRCGFSAVARSKVGFSDLRDFDEAVLRLSSVMPRVHQ